MGTEIERKYLIKDIDKLRSELSGIKNVVSQHIKQVYISDNPQIRIREVIFGTNLGFESTRYYITIKGDGDLVREEYEFEIHKNSDVLSLMKECDFYTEKTRHSFLDEHFQYWEIDEFEGKHSGLWLAEIELVSADTEVKLHDWIGEEVTFDKQYKNINLAKKMNSFPATSLGWTEEFCSNTFGGVPILIAPANDTDHQGNLDFLNKLKEIKDAYDKQEKQEVKKPFQLTLVKD